VGTAKRERQKQGRQARLEAAQEAQRRQQQKSRRITIGIAAVVVLGALFAYSTFAGGASDEDATTTTT
jgi:flagellar basal body-associated protein FliL